MVNEDDVTGGAASHDDTDDDATRIASRASSPEDDERTFLAQRLRVEDADAAGLADTGGGTGGDTHDRTIVSSRRSGKHALTLPGSGRDRTTEAGPVVDSFAPPEDGAVPSRVIAAYPPREIPPPPPSPAPVADGPAPTRTSTDLPSVVARSRRGARRTLAVFTVSCVVAAAAAAALVVIWI